MADDKQLQVRVGLLSAVGALTKLSQSSIRKDRTVVRDLPLSVRKVRLERLSRGCPDGVFINPSRPARLDLIYSALHAAGAWNARPQSAAIDRIEEAVTTSDRVKNRSHHAFDRELAIVPIKALARSAVQNVTYLCDQRGWNAAWRAFLSFDNRKKEVMKIITTIMFAAALAISSSAAFAAGGGAGGASGGSSAGGTKGGSSMNGTSSGMSSPGSSTTTPGTTGMGTGTGNDPATRANPGLNANGPCNGARSTTGNTPSC